MPSIWERLVKRATVKALRELETDENYVFVRRSRLFKDLGVEAMWSIMRALTERHYKPGEIIFREGNPGICLFLVKSGRVEIFSQAIDNADESRTVYSVVGEGTMFGEISIISMAYRTSSAKALDHDTTLLTLSTYDVKQLLEEFPTDGLKVLRGITDTIISHLITTDQQLRETSHQVKLLKEKLAKNE